jgi:para-nitrobenzyl esterase
MKTWLLILSATAASTVHAAGSDPILRIAAGQVRGLRLQRGGAVFKGIPYAGPPVGDLRWRAPMPAQPWTGVRDATKFGAVCAQNPGIIPDAARISSEDCLFLNVWIPEWPTKGRKPVMVWIPGGGNFGGAGSERVYDGESLARRGVVLVSLNYRLGVFGFFAHPELTRESEHHTSGNQGILDQIAALQWVRDNIATFDGDPNNVTIFGESAGSLNLSVLLTSPLSKGLFRRAIGESGAVILNGDPQPLSEAEKRGQDLVARWKLPAAATLRTFRALSTAEILKAEPDYFVGANIPPNLGIVVDGYVFPRIPAAVFAAGQEHPVPLLLGSNSLEFTPGTRPPADLVKAMEAAYGPMADRARTLYVGDDPLYGSPVSQWATDTSFRCATVAQLSWHAAAGNPAFEYEFARVLPGRAQFAHSSELAYVFGTLGLVGATRGVGPPADATELDREISEEMQQYWTNFAKTGNPNGGTLPRWPRFDVSGRRYLQFTDARPVAKEGLRRPWCDLFIENVRRTMPK